MRQATIAATVLAMLTTTSMAETLIRFDLGDPAPGSDGRMAVTMEGTVIETTAGPFWSISLLPTGGNGPYLLDVAGDLPVGMEVDRVNGALVGTISETGTSSVLVGVMDADGAVLSVPMSIVVEETPDPEVSRLTP